MSSSDAGHHILQHGEPVFSRLRILSSTLEQTLEAATAGITAALEAATMGYTPAAPAKGATRTRRRERMRNQKRIVKWVDLEAPSSTRSCATTVGEGEAHPPTSQVCKRSRGRESYHDADEREESDQHIVFRALADKERKETQSFVARALHESAAASADGDDDAACDVADDVAAQLWAPEKSGTEPADRARARREGFFH